MTEGKQKMEKVRNSPKDNILKGDLTNDSRFQSVYGKLLNCMYDVVIIYDNEKNKLYYDSDKYFDLFGVKTNFTNLDQWFWHMCSNSVMQEDTELLDIFRSNDIFKRIKSGKYVVEDDIRIKNKEKGYIWIRMVVVFIPNDRLDNIDSVFIMFRNIDNRKRLELDYIYKSQRDSLTHIYNKEYSSSMIKEFLSGVREQNSVYGILDIDDFKNVNDTFGHMAGDVVLKRVADLLFENVDNDDIVGRLNGDEFVFLLKKCGDVEKAKKRIERLLKRIRFEYTEGDETLNIQCSIGAAIVDKDCKETDALYKKADRNLYEAKNYGKNMFIIS